MESKILVCMVQPAGLEPATSSFAGRRSNPTELWLHIFSECLDCIYFSEIARTNRLFLASWHTIKIKSLEIRHWFCEKVFLFSFFKKSSLINNTHLYELICIFCWEFFLWKCFFVLIISSSFFVWEIESRLFIFIPSIHKCRFLFPFWEFTRCRLFLYETCGESMRIGHVLFVGRKFV